MFSPLYSVGEQPVIRLKNLPNTDDDGKFIILLIWLMDRLVEFNNAMHSVAVCLSM